MLRKDWVENVVHGGKTRELTLVALIQVYTTRKQTPLNILKWVDRSSFKNYETTII